MSFNVLLVTKETGQGIAVGDPFSIVGGVVAAVTTGRINIGCFNEIKMEHCEGNNKKRIHKVRGNFSLFKGNIKIEFYCSARIPVTFYDTYSIYIELKVFKGDEKTEELKGMVSHEYAIAKSKPHTSFIFKGFEVHSDNDDYLEMDGDGWDACKTVTVFTEKIISEPIKIKDIELSALCQAAKFAIGRHFGDISAYHTSLQSNGSTAPTTQMELISHRRALAIQKSYNEETESKDKPFELKRNSPVLKLVPIKGDKK